LPCWPVMFGSMLITSIIATLVQSTLKASGLWQIGRLLPRIWA